MWDRRVVGRIAVRVDSQNRSHLPMVQSGAVGSAALCARNVMFGRLPADHAAGRWFVDATNRTGHTWVYPDTCGALWRVDQQWARQDWAWTELPLTPYDTDLGRISDEEV
jgi:hypothetical protein